MKSISNPPPSKSTEFSTRPLEQVVIPLPEHFAFAHHRAFRTAYINKPIPVKGFIVDFAQTRSIDSAGLGMLLQLHEFALGDPKRIHLTNCAPQIRETLVIAGFAEHATIGN